MAEQIRLSLTVDAGVKKLIEDAAREYADGNTSAYVRGLAAFHALLENKRTGRADIPGWILDCYPLGCIEAMRQASEKWQADLEKAGEEAVDHFTKHDKPRLKK
jgi:hypothetical protein